MVKLQLVEDSFLVYAFLLSNYKPVRHRRTNRQTDEQDP